MSELSSDDFNRWKHHPVSKIFFQYLHDKRRFLTSAMTDQWLSGTLTMQTEQTVRGQIIELMELEILPFGAIESFYMIEAIEETDNAAETPEV